MTDLSLATYEEIRAEMVRRYPAWLLVLRHQPEGTLVQDMRIDFYAPHMAEALGMAHLAAQALQNHMASQRRNVTGGLDS